jgi:hypothetical protein
MIHLGQARTNVELQQVLVTQQKNALEQVPHALLMQNQLQNAEHLRATAM